MTSFATQPASALPETPENASEPPHCRARRRLPTGSGVRLAAATSGSQPSISSDARATSSSNPRFDAKERMWHVAERVVAVLHELPHVVVAVGACAVVGRKHRAHVGMHHEACEHPEHVA